MATIFTDDFNSYNDGDLNGQGSWSGDTSFDVQTSVVFEGAKAISCASTSLVNILKTGTAQTAGVFYCYVRRTASNNGRSFVVLMEGTTIIDYYDINASAQVKSGDGTVLGSYSADTWFPLAIEWKSSPTHQVRFLKPDLTWGNWTSPSDSDWTTAPDGIRLQVYTQTTSTSYFDYIAENPYTPPAVGRSQAHIF